jgi:uncharacterized membrane protein
MVILFLILILSEIGQGETKNMVVANPFLLDLTSDIGIFVLACIIGLASFFFYRKSFNFSGLLCWFVGMLLLYNEINFFIAGIAFFIGTMLIIGGRS